MNTTRAAKMHAVQKKCAWAARLDDEQEEKSHFDRLPLHLQLHIRELAKEAFAREHMQWKVHADLLFTVARRKLKRTALYLEGFNVATQRINTYTNKLEKERLDVLAALAISTARSRALTEWVALSKQLNELLSELWEVTSQLRGIYVCMAKNPSCPGQLQRAVCLRIHAFFKLDLEPMEKQKHDAGRLL